MGASFSRSRLLFSLALLGAPLAPRPAAAQAPKLYINNIFVSYPNPVRADDKSVSTNQTCNGGGNVAGGNGPLIEFEQPPTDPRPAACPGPYPIDSMFLCVEVAHSSEVSSVDVVRFEVFKFGNTTNPLDEGSAPPLRTFDVFNAGNYVEAAFPGVHGLNGEHTVCTTWNGFYNIQGLFGKTNGQFGFRAKVSTKQNSPSAGSIDLSNVVAYPGGSLNKQNQFPINVDVVNIHAIASSPTLVGRITPVAAQPYNIFYRLSKDASVTLQIYDPAVGFASPVRTIVPGLPRVGEGTPFPSLTNGDFWDGRDNKGNLVPGGVYIARFNAVASDAWGTDRAFQVDREVAIDPLQVTDVSIAPLTNSNTALAVLNYTLTEPATVYVDIWSPGTSFKNVDACSAPYCPGPSYAIFDSALNPVNPAANVNAGTLLRRIVEHKTARANQLSFWDGRDSNNQPVRDNNYVFAVNAVLPSVNSGGSPVILENQKPQVGYVPVSRGMVGISQISPATSVFGSSPAISGLPPYNFGYSLSRDAIVTMNVLLPGSTVVAKTLVDREIRSGGQLIVEKWLDGVKNDGAYPSSGSYIVQLFAQDTLFGEKISSTTAGFPINLARIADVSNTALLSGASEQVQLGYTLSQPMNATWNIYPPGTLIPSTGAWPPPASSIVLAGGGQASPVFSVRGMRPGRTRITESWDGRNQNGLFVPDGQYLFTLVAVSTTSPALVATDKIIGSLTVARGQVLIPTFNTSQFVPKAESGGQVVPLPPIKVEFSITRQSSVTLRILDTSLPPKVVRTLLSGDVRDPNVVNSEFWDGRDELGTFVPAGFYNAQLIVADLASDFTNPTTAQSTLSVDPLRIYDVAVSALRKDAPSAQISYQISEPMKVVIKIYKPGTTFNAFGAPSPPETVSLVKRIVGVRPAREVVSDSWDGTDLQLVQVPDGNYLFKITASPEISKIDSITGAVAAGTLLASDAPVNEIPVTRSASADPQGDFEGNSIAYPNPSKGKTVKFRVRVPIQAKVTLRLYTMAGDLVRSLSSSDFSSESSYPACGSSDSYCDYTWARDNSGGKQVAPGVYFAVIREEATLGQAQVFQTVKKLLLQ